MMENQYDCRTHNGGIAGIRGRSPEMKLPSPIPAKPTLRQKFTLIAELFELDVLSEEDALKACNVAIQQHAKPQSKIEKYGYKAEGQQPTE